MSRKQFLFGSASGVIQLIFIALLTIICIPIFIKTLGSEAYGVFAILSLIGNLNVFTNIGINTSLVKYLAEQGKSKESDLDIIVTISILFVIISPVTILLILFKNFILLKIFVIPLDLLRSATVLYSSLLFSNILILIGQSFNAVLSALQKIYINNILQMVYNGLYWLSIILMLVLGYGLAEIGYVILLSTIIWFFLVFYFSMRYWGKLNIQGIGNSYKRIAEKQIGYGSKIYFSGMVAFFIEPLTKILISNFIGIKEVGFFDIALKVKAQFQGLITRLLDPFYPYISQISNVEKLKHIIIDIEQKFLLLSLPLIAILIFVLKPLLDIWLGPDSNEQIVFSSILITCIHLITMSVLPIYYFLVSKNHVGKTVVLNLVTVFMNIVIFFLFYLRYGYYAPVIGLCCGVTLSFLLTLYYQKKYLDCYMFSSNKPVYKLILTFILLLFINYLLYHFIDNKILLIVLIICCTVVLSIFTYRQMNLIEKNDIVTYFGSENRLSKLLVKIFISGE